MNRKLIAISLCSLLLTFACQKEKTETAGTLEKEKQGVLVEVQNLKAELFEHHVAINGSVEAILEVFVSPETNGQIKKVHVREGDRVRKGDLLVSLNSDSVRSGIAEVKSSLELAVTVYERRKGLWEKKIGSEIQVLEARAGMESLQNRLKSLEAQLDMAEIRAPINGIVDKIDRKEGELAMPGLELLQLVNLQKMRINAEMAETYLGRIREGDPVEIVFPSYTDRRLQTKIKRISNSINPKNRTVIIQVELENPDESVKPNMMASLMMRDFVEEKALVIPAIIIKNDMQGPFVYLAEDRDGGTQAVKRYIRTGLTEQGRTMVVEGLEEGQRVIVAGYNQVSNGMTVRVQ